MPLRISALIATVAALSMLPSAALAAPTWLEPANLTPASNSVVSSNSFPPVPVTDAGADAQGNVIAVWGRQTAGASVIEMAYRPAGGSFSVATLQSGPEAAGDTAVAVNSAGDAIVAWTRSTTDNVVWASYRPAGGSFGTPVAVGSAPGRDANMPEVDVNESGAAIVVWRFGDPGGETIHASFRPAGAAFGTAEPISSTARWNREPVVALDEQNRATVVWSFWSGTVNIGRARVRAANGTLGTQRDLSGSQPTGGAIYPDVDVDAAGNAVAVWSHCRAPCADIGAGPFDVEGASRLAGADTWSPFVPFGTGPAPYGNLDPQVAVDKDGNAVAVWIAPNRSVQSASRASGGGFGTPQTGISAPYAEGIRLAMDPRGNAVALWVRRDGAGEAGFLGACPCRIEAAAKPAGGVFATVRTVSTKLDSHSAGLGVDGQGNAVAVWAHDDPALPDATDTVVQAAGYDAAAPTLSDVSVPGAGLTRQTLTFSASASDVWSPITTRWTFGDGTDATGSAVEHAFGSPGAFQTRVTATDAVGNSSEASRVVQVTTPPPPPPTDADRDGVPVPQDCNDTNPGIRPGATDIPGNGVDEDCAGGDAIVVIGADFTNKWTIWGKYTTVFRLDVKRVPAGGKVVLTCKGKGCKFKKRTVNAKTAKTVKLTKYFNVKKKGSKRKKVAKLRPKTKVRITVTRPGAIGSWFVATVRKGKKFPKTKQGCLAVNSTSSRIPCPK